MSETGEAEKIFYGTEDQGTLDDEIDEVLERHFDGLDTESIPETVKVLFWRRKPIDIQGQAGAPYWRYSWKGWMKTTATPTDT